MEDEIKVGDYVRTQDGMLGTFVRYSSRPYYSRYKSPCDCFIQLQGRKTTLQCYRDYILKHKPNIIDLVEAGDFIKIEYYVGKYRKRITRIFEVNKIDNTLYFENTHMDFYYDLKKQEWMRAKGYNPKIITIVTNEQFKTMEYEVK